MQVHLGDGVGGLAPPSAVEPASGAVATAASAPSMQAFFAADICVVLECQESLLWSEDAAAVLGSQASWPPRCFSASGR
eukprot:m.189894 g.189894  ORF g.189894 m.189894 type:complete len:79 (+) comp15118_c2_seq4:2219-2455(+)